MTPLMPTLTPPSTTPSAAPSPRPSDAPGAPRATDDALETLLDALEARELTHALLTTRLWLYETALRNELAADARVHAALARQHHAAAELRTLARDYASYAVWRYRRLVADAAMAEAETLYHHVRAERTRS